MYVAQAEKAGVDRARLGGTLQNDILKEYQAQKEFVFPPRPSMRLVRDTIAFTAAEMPRWHPVSISGYHIREAGSTAAQELAFTLANGFAYVELALQAGLAGRRVRAAAQSSSSTPTSTSSRRSPSTAPPGASGPAGCSERYGAADASARCSCASTPRPPACRSPRSSPRSTSSAPRSRRWPACSAARRACTPTRWTRRSPCRPRRRRASRCARSRCIAHETERRQRRRSARRLVVRRGAHRRDGAPGRGDLRPPRRARATARCSRASCRHRGRLVPGRDRRRRLRARAQGQRGPPHRRRRQPLHRGQRRRRDRPPRRSRNEDEARQLKRLERVRHDRDAGCGRRRARQGCGARPPIPRSTSCRR